MLIQVDRLQAAGREYTRLRRLRGMPPLKKVLRAVAVGNGPVIIRCQGVEYTLMEGNTPCASA